MSPDESAASAFFTSPTFRFGVTRGKWSLLRLEWPHAFISIAADRAKGPESYLFRVNLDGYPSVAPEFLPWDDATSATLAPNEWPTGADRIAIAFQFCGAFNAHIGIGLYWPGDRLGLRLHPAWIDGYPTQAWNRKRDLSHCLEYLHELLVLPDYSGPRRSAASR